MVIFGRISTSKDCILSTLLIVDSRIFPEAPVIKELKLDEKARMEDGEHSSVCIFVLHGTKVVMFWVSVWGKCEVEGIQWCRFGLLSWIDDSVEGGKVGIY